MKVLLTGASGFVGSHILDTLLASDCPTAVLLRPTSDEKFIATNLPKTERRQGSLDDSESLGKALEGITHVIHCAGATKAVGAAGFFAVNQVGTRNLVDAVNARGRQIERFVHISSLAGAGPGTAACPATESAAPRPVSIYGKSKLAGENEVALHCQAPFTIIRPPAVYGPRDAEILRLFKAVKSHLLPTFGGGRQELSFVFVKDLAQAAVHVLTHPAAAGKTFFAAGDEVVTTRQFGEMIAAQMKTWTIAPPLPMVALWPVCAVQEVLSRLTKKANIVSLQKYAELSAPGWVCRADKLRSLTGFSCQTTLQDGLAKTLAWYREQRWL